MNIDLSLEMSKTGPLRNKYGPHKEGYVEVGFWHV